MLIGDFAGAWTYNPLGPILVVGAIATLGRHLIGLGTGRWLTLRLVCKWVVAFVAVAVIVLEVNQQLHAALLMSSS